MRNLQLPQAIKATSQIPSYSQSSLEAYPNVKFMGAQIDYINKNNNHMVYAHLRNNKLTLFLVDYDTTTLINGKQEFTTVATKEATTHACKTMPDGEIWIPSRWFYFDSKDHIVLFSNSNSHPCSNDYGKIYVWKFIYSHGSYLQTDHGIPSNFQGSQAFYDPNLLGLGLPVFSGYTKVVSISYKDYPNYQYKILPIVFYEDT